MISYVLKAFSGLPVVLEMEGFTMAVNGKLSPSSRAMIASDFRFYE